MLPVAHVIDGIYVSGFRATHFTAELQAAKITHVLKLYEGTPYFPSQFQTLENGLNDGEFIPMHVLRRGLDFLQEQVKAHNPVLVMCGAGISRSSAFILAYLLEKGYDLHDAYRLLRQAHPPAKPHYMVWISLISHYKLDYKLRDAIIWMNEDAETG